MIFLLCHHMITSHKQSHKVRTNQGVTTILTYTSLMTFPHRQHITQHQHALHPPQPTQYSPLWSYDDIAAIIRPYLPPAQVTTYPVSAAVELIALRLDLPRLYVQSTVELAVLNCTAHGQTPSHFFHPSELIPLAVHVYVTHCQFAPATFIAPLPPAHNDSLAKYLGIGEVPTLCPAPIPPEVEKKICKQFRTTGMCTFGSRCLYHHSIESAMQAVAAKAAERAKWEVGAIAPVGASHSNILAAQVQVSPSRPKRAREPFTDLSNKII